MRLYDWLALAGSAVAAIAALVFAITRGLAAWRAFRRLMRTLGDGIAQVTSRAELIEQHLEKAGKAAERLQQAQAQLRESLATASVLAAAFDEARRLVPRP